MDNSNGVYQQGQRTRQRSSPDPIASTRYERRTRQRIERSPPDDRGKSPENKVQPPGERGESPRNNKNMSLHLSDEQDSDDKVELTVEQNMDNEEPVKKHILMVTLANDCAISPQNDLLDDIQRMCPDENFHITTVEFTKQSEIEYTLKEFDHNVCMFIMNTHAERDLIKTGTYETAQVYMNGTVSESMTSLLGCIEQATTPHCKIILASCRAAKYLAIQLETEEGVYPVEDPLDPPQIKPLACREKEPYSRTIYTFGEYSGVGVAAKCAEQLPGRSIYASACLQVGNELTTCKHLSDNRDICGKNTIEVNIGVLSDRQRMYILTYDPLLESNVSQDMPSALYNLPPWVG